MYTFTRRHAHFDVLIPDYEPLFKVNDVADSHGGLLVFFWNLVVARIDSSFISREVCSPLRSSKRDNYSCLSPKSQSHCEVARLLVWAASLSNVNVGTDVMLSALPLLPSTDTRWQPFLLSTFSIYLLSIKSLGFFFSNCFSN